MSNQSGSEQDPDFPRIISEADAHMRYKHLIEDKELRRARQNGELGYFRRKRRIYYREEELVAFLNRSLENAYRHGRATRKS